ncbi:unnamed protein product [Trichogramma brassicae]|uniref:Uncharacterized protein n=1 Tax=Trichogramma brassicae TaxID=86971 RepID=A0A6H5IML9_9HYME|nr:unnamed protein product [Trichogramma brassicae]
MMYSYDDEFDVNVDIDTDEGDDFDDNDFEHAKVLSNPEKLEKLKSLREKIDWKVDKELRKFIHQIRPLLKHRKGPLPDLRDIFRPEEIDQLITQIVTHPKLINKRKYPGKRFIDFVIATGYKDRPKVDEDGETESPIRTTPVHWIVRRRFPDWEYVVRKLFRIYDRFDVNYVDELDRTHFHVACMSECDYVVEKFLQSGQVQINAQDKLGNAPLHMMLRFGIDGRDLLKLLLRSGANPNLKNFKGSTPLHIMRKRFRYDSLVETFFKVNKKIDQLVEVNAQDKLGNTPLHLALESGNKEMTEWLLSRGADLNLTNEEGSTPLHMVCQNSGNHDTMEIWRTHCEVKNKISQWVEVNAQNKLGNTPLHLALESCNKEMTEWLLSRGADLNLANEEGLTPFHILCQNSGNGDIMEIWWTHLEVKNEISQWVEVNAQDKLGNTPLHYALNDSCDRYLIKLLLRNGADVNLANEERSTPLHFICQNFQDMLVGIIFEVINKFDQLVEVNAQDKLGNTPLHLALKFARFSMNKTKLECLLENGADANLDNKEGSTPLHIICSRRMDDDLPLVFFEVCDEVDRMVEVDARDKKGRTPLQLAVANLLPFVVGVLLQHGADLSSFTFPAENCFVEVLERTSLEEISIFKSRVASSALAVVESLEKGGYELDRSDALTIMKLFAIYGLFDKSADLEKSWYDDEKFVENAKKISLCPGHGLIEKYVFLRYSKHACTLFHEISNRPKLSLYDLTRLRPEEAEKQIVYPDILEFVRQYDSKFPDSHSEDCAVHLCEKLSKKFFRQWALDAFYELIHERLTPEGSSSGKTRRLKRSCSTFDHTHVSSIALDTILRKSRYVYDK